MSSSTALYFNYSSTARIRIKKTNCFYCEDYPCIYRIVTKKLDFIIPRNAVIFGVEEKHKSHVFIPLSIYREKLTQFYSNVKR